MEDFAFEYSSRGLYAIRFPKRHPCLRPGLRLGGSVLRKYFKNPRVKFESLKLDLSGFTLFQKKVYSVLRKVPAGKVVTYGELARRAGHPGAARAVGTAMKKNRLPIVIPCHRVVKADGSIGQYSSGVKWKRWLLGNEKYSRTTSNGQRVKQ